MKNTLFLITAPSGSGKTSIMRMVMNNEVVSFTTRHPRNNEVDGVDYIYISKEEFEIMKDSGELAEHITYEATGDSYGITMTELRDKLYLGSAFAIVTHHGMEQLKAIYPNCVTIFLLTDKEDAIEFMKSRGDSNESIENRLKTFDEEQSNRVYYDYVIKNERGFMSHAKNIIKTIVDMKTQKYYVVEDEGG